jgi:hypothetical protein
MFVAAGGGIGRRGKPRLRQDENQRGTYSTGEDVDG